MILAYLLTLFPQVRVKPGESALAFYTAENKSSTPITGVSTYNVTPMKVQVDYASLNHRLCQPTFSYIPWPLEFFFSFHELIV